LRIKGLNLGSLRQFLVPLPPLAEQRRIVAKVEQLMALCDRLELEIQAGEKYSRSLLNALIRDALDAKVVAT
jgi:type I restriction enzyme S subunit